MAGRQDQGNLPKEGTEVGLWFQRAGIYDGEAKAQLRAHTLFHNQEAQSKNLTGLLKPLSLSLVTHLKKDHTYLLKYMKTEY